MSKNIVKLNSRKIHSAPSLHCARVNTSKSEYLIKELRACGKLMDFKYLIYKILNYTQKLTSY